MLLLFGIAFIIVVILGLIKKVRHVLPVFISVLLIAAITETFSTANKEIFKSPKVLEAVLKDDLSTINLTLRKNNTFEMSAVTLFSEEKFEGVYKHVNDKIIFLNKPYSNNFIPDTVIIRKDKIILRFDSTGEPVVTFASYFTIKLNLLQNGL